jgi:3-oxoacyl-[acyl-carrier-protein] synthase II
MSEWVVGNLWGAKRVKNRVAITGVGVVSPLGVGIASMTGGLRAGRSGVTRLAWSHARVASSVAATCPEFDPGQVVTGADIDRLPRLVPMALAAAREACARAGLRVGLGEGEGAGEEASRRIALVLGTGGGGIDFTLAQAEAVHHGRRPSLWTITNATHGNLAGELSIRLGLRGASLCVSTGCASSSDACGMARDMLLSERPGAPEIVVVVGADAHVSWETLSAMELLGVVSTRKAEDEAEAARVSRPFDKRRDGFVLGEGAFAVVLERAQSAARREVEPLAWLRGYGATCDAHHRVRPAADMRESARAMELAMMDAGLTPGEIDVIQYHGTATVLNDALETKAVRMAFGEHASRLRGSSVKSMMGHPQGASGLAGLTAVVGALGGMDGGLPFVPPTVNLEEADPACDLNYTPGVARETRGTKERVLVNCLAFGAKNSALVVEMAGEGD